MVQLATTISRDLPIFFNLDSPVGAGQTTARQDDVLFVQYFFSLVAAKTANAEFRASFGAVTPTGRLDDATVEAIMFWQLKRKEQFGRSKIDNVIHPARGRTGSYAGDPQYDIVAFNVNIMKVNKSIWPRVDKDPLCPPGLAPALRAALGIELTP